MARARLSLRGQFVERDDHRREREGEQRWWSVVAKDGGGDVGSWEVREVRFKP